MPGCQKVGKDRATTMPSIPNAAQTPPTCNPSTLGFLRQNVGVLDKAADVTLTFDVSAPWQSKDVLLSVSILTGDLLELAAGDFQPGAKQKLVARNVPAGTSVVLAFQAVRATPGLDNVAVSVEPATAPAPVASPVATAGRRITVASYYFGNYHPGDPRNAKNKGQAWSEWELVKAAKPRFPGHQQPNVPLWGYADESDPKVMEQKIAAAADHGIDAFIFDWYYYNDGPFLDRPIDIGFLKARNNARLKFAFMWANHDWLEIQPYKRGTRPEAPLSRHRDAGELREDRRPRDQGLLPASVLLADRRAALLLRLRPDRSWSRASAAWRRPARRSTSSAPRPWPPGCPACT